MRNRKIGGKGLYLEAVFNVEMWDSDGVFSTDAETRARHIRRNMQVSVWDAYTSYTVINEINNASEETAARLINLIKEFNITVLPPHKDIYLLADIYVREGVIPLKCRDDAVHIAIASMYGLDIIISWNFKHIVKRKTILMTNLINTRENYKQISIHSPTEVIEYVE